MENIIQNKWWIIWLACHAIWIIKCTEYLHEINERSVEIFHWEICHSLPRWYTSVQLIQRRTFEVLEICHEEVTTREIDNKLENVFISKVWTYISWFCPFWGEIKYRRWKVKIYPRMAFTQEYFLGKKLSWTI